MLELDYYDVGTQGDPVISNSSLHSLDPTEGGSIISFMNFFVKKEETTEKTALFNGKLVHRYIQKPNDFVIEDFEKPTAMMATLLEQIVLERDALIKGFFDKDVSIDISNDFKSPKAKEAGLLETRNCFEKLANLLQLDVDNTIRVFRAGRSVNTSYKNYTEANVLGSIIADTQDTRAYQYTKFLLDSREKFVLSEKDGQKVKGAINSLSTNSKVASLLGLQNDDIDGAIGECFVETAAYWQEAVTNETLFPNEKLKINCKALMDRVVVNHHSKIIKLIDLKTTKDSIYLFQDAMEKYRYYRQLAFYQRALANWFKATYPDHNYADYKVSLYLVPVETSGYFLSGIYDMSNGWLYKGKKEIHDLLSRYAWHRKTGEYQYSLEERLNGGLLKFKEPTN